VLDEAVALAHEMSALPQLCQRNDRLSAYDSIGLSHDEAMAAEWARGLISLQEAAAGAARFAAGQGRHGTSA
jgi:enoyl-CoA hydratase